MILNMGSRNADPKLGHDIAFRQFGVFFLYLSILFISGIFVCFGLQPTATCTFSMSYILISSSSSNRVLHVNIKQALR